MLVIKRVVPFGGTIVSQWTSLSVTSFSVCHGLTSPKKHSPYSSVDSERYSSLVKSTMTSRTSSQTVDSIEAEDEHIYGPVIKASKPSITPKVREAKTLHPFLHCEETLETEEPESGPPTRISISHVLEDVSAVRAIESTVQHETLNYLGVADCVARYRGVLCVIDWKTSEKPKPYLRNTYDNPIQVAAYAGALNSDGNYKYQVENGLIVVAYKDGSPGHAHELSSELMSEYWNAWLLRLQEFTEQSIEDLKKPYYFFNIW
uniref:Mitochondrial genome maintenance exonuclease 1 n=1 Tax=Dicentrarchus labrax TaxID=13489 RepID=A0A8C4GDB4_DICLA